MTHRALTLLAVIGVAFAAAGLLFAGAANASGHSATRTITPASVAAGGHGDCNHRVRTDQRIRRQCHGNSARRVQLRVVRSWPTVGRRTVKMSRSVPFDVPDDTFTYTRYGLHGSGRLLVLRNCARLPNRTTRDVGGDTDDNGRTAPHPAHRSHRHQDHRPSVSDDRRRGDGDGRRNWHTGTPARWWKHCRPGSRTCPVAEARPPARRSRSISPQPTRQSHTWPPPPTQRATYSISGVLTASDGVTADVGGATDVTVTEPPPPVTGPNATRRSPLRQSRRAECWM